MKMIALIVKATRCHKPQLTSCSAKGLLSCEKTVTRSYVAVTGSRATRYDPVQAIDTSSCNSNQWKLDENDFEGKLVLRSLFVFTKLRLLATEKISIGGP